MDRFPAGPFRLLLAFGWIACMAPAEGHAQAAGGYGDYLDWEGWARVCPSGRAGLASSTDPGGGAVDNNHYEFPPGHLDGDYDVTAATLRGPGIIYRFWMPHYTATRPFAIRMYFDGETTPRIDTDSEQILGGTFSYFRSPLVTTFAGGQVCYEPIAFRDSLRIDTENREGLAHFYQYTYRIFEPGTCIASWDGSLAPETRAARSATIAMFLQAGRHPDGESASAARHVVGPSAIPEDGVLTIGDLGGPGWIRKLNMRMDGASDADLDSLRLRVFWDFSDVPAIDAPVGWFYGAGHDRASYRSLPIGTDSRDGFYCYWPMPYRREALIQLWNTTTHPVTIDSTVVEFDLKPVGPDMGYLHAVAKSDTREAGTIVHEMVETHGTGHYVGNVLYLEQDHASHYMLEGDEIIVADETAIQGTGVEDAYNGGYYYNWVANPMDEPEGPSPPSAIRPLNGILCVDKRQTPPFARADQYRWMIADRVPFQESLRVSVETRYAQLGSRWTSVAFWYQLPSTGSGVLPPGGAGDRGARLWIGPIRPNPATDEIVVSFALAAAGPARLDLLDLRGRKVATLSDRLRPAGLHEVRWGGKRLPSGVYFVRAASQGGSGVRRLIVIH